ncbi:MAG: hypothetical protein ACRDH2_13135, partial [Anaerolineales bacterium]
MTPAARPRAEWFPVILLTGLILIIANLPYLLAYAAPTSHVFTGILLNPIDGHSYLAKMREGWRGAWLFTLPYTAEPGPGVFIFTYYLLLGHLARWTGASLELIYHVARVGAGTFFLLTAYHFIARFFASVRARLVVWLLFALGSGLGWVAALFGGFTADLWVAESIPFLSVFGNSHFCLTWALLLWIFEWTLPGLAPLNLSAMRLMLIALAVTLQAQIQPLALLTIGLVLGGMVLGLSLARRTWIWQEWLPLLVVGLFAAPWLLYDGWAAATQPVLAIWNAQNVTPAPPLWEALIWGGAPLLLAVPGAVVAARRRSPLDLVLLYWLGLGVLSLYAPFALQRRLSLGLWMPICILAGNGFGEVIWPRLGARAVRAAARPFALAALVVSVLSSNLLVYAATLGAIQARKPALFLTSDEAAALRWLADESVGKLVLASPDMGLFIPARTDARVIYGHPFETAGAAASKQAVE